MSDFLSNEELNSLVAKAKEGNNDAWEEICKNVEAYVHDRVWKRLLGIDMPADKRMELAEDLYMAGWQGFVSAIRNHDPEKGKLLTYATYYIDGEISKELDTLFNPLGLTDRPKKAQSGSESEKISRVSLETYQDILAADNSSGHSIELPDAPNRERYNAERRTLQILDVLRLATDENHAVSKDELARMLKLYRIAKYENGFLEAYGTFTDTLESILLELDPLEYSEELDDDYGIKYKGYKEDLLKKKLNKEKGKKAEDITGFSYVHTFDNDTLDKLLQLVSFSDMLSESEKTGIIDKLVGTASVYYRSPFWDGEKIRFNPKAIHGRLSNRKQEEKINLSCNLKVIQQAINNMGQICFKFGRYTADHSMVPKTDFLHRLSPYHLVVYHDNYYVIGLKSDRKTIWHYRVDLMSEVEIVRDDEGKIVPIEVSAFEGLPITNAAWNPEKYMSEHLNMAYDDPRDIRIKIRNTDYTIIHDWFGDHYEKVDETTGTDDEGNEISYDIVKVRTSASMIVHWAMQYGSKVEIMDEDIRSRIGEEARRVLEKYEKTENM